MIIKVLFDKFFNFGDLLPEGGDLRSRQACTSLSCKEPSHACSVRKPFGVLSNRRTSVFSSNIKATSSVRLDTSIPRTDISNHLLMRKINSFLGCLFRRLNLVNPGSYWPLRYRPALAITRLLLEKMSHLLDRLCAS